MEIAADEIYNKLTNIKTETDIIEARMVKTREHLEHTVNQIETTKHLIFKGFHKANQRIRRIEGQVNEIALKMDALIEAVNKKS
jgi:DNA anti-recombination protein RmuC